MMWKKIQRDQHNFLSAVWRQALP